MRVSYRWLQEFVPVEASPEELADRLTMVGLEVDGVERPWRLVRGVVAARVARLSPHPANARLRVAEVDAGDRTYTVVTAAPNAREGMWVAFAPPGARIADGRTLEVADFQGVASEGMCLSADELALPELREQPGLLVLDPAVDWKRGQDLIPALELDDAVLELELTANYAAHCQSVLGVAREVAALLELPMRDERRGPRTVEELASGGGRPAADGAPGRGGEAGRAGKAGRYPEVAIADEEGCGRYVARFVEGLCVRPSPLWLARRLQAAGVRPLSNVVDVTNYVMLELGQPLHAFDLDRLRGGRISPRAAAPGERITTLDGVERALQPGDLVIADGRGPVAIAGVMGGEASEVRGDTRRILLESAWFHPRRVGKVARRLGLMSEASSRFEKGVDVNGCRAAADRAAALIQSLAGGTVADEVKDAYPRPVKPLRLPLDVAQVSALLGVELSPEEASSCLARLGIRADDPHAMRTVVTVPTYRTDVTEPVDLVEEVGRVHGMDRIPATPLQGAPGEDGLSLRDRQVRRLRNVILAAGCSEVVTFSFHPTAWLRRLGLGDDDPRAHPVRVANPLSEAHEAMRTLLLPSLLEALAGNRRMRRPDVALFEIARVYLARRGETAAVLPKEPMHLGFVAHGAVAPAHFSSGPRAPADFFFGKGIAEAVFARLRVAGVEWTRAEEPFLHPGRSARAASGGTPLGWVGEVHPEVRARWDLAEPVVAGELDLEAILALARELPELKPVPRHPSVTRDLAAVFDEEVSSAEVERVMRDAGGDLLQEVLLFDVYRGEHVEEGRRSLAYRLVYQDPRRTLTDDEVERLHEAVRRAVATRLGGMLRS